MNATQTFDKAINAYKEHQTAEAITLLQAAGELYAKENNQHGSELCEEMLKILSGEKGQL